MSGTGAGMGISIPIPCQPTVKTLCVAAALTLPPSLVDGERRLEGVHEDVAQAKWHPRVKNTSTGSAGQGRHAHTLIGWTDKRCQYDVE